MVVADEVDCIEFKWGKKRGLGGKKKDVQFYESFTYDGVEYTLYDSVYLYKVSETEPYIGKLIEIWEADDKTKKVKVLWFFRPREISNFLGAVTTSENELFLAFGEGVGLANVNPLEAIAGKSFVICISKDSRNLLPSDEELQRADFIFYRMFDVGRRMILDEIDGKIAGIDVKFIFNPVSSQKWSDDGRINSNKKEVSGSAHSKAFLDKQKSVLGEKPAFCVGEKSTEMAKIVYIQENTCGEKPPLKSRVEETTDAKRSLVKQDSSLREKPTPSVGVQFNDKQQDIFGDKGRLRSKYQEIEDLLKPSLVKQKSSMGGKCASNLGVDLGERANNNGQENVSSDKFTSRSQDDFVRSESKASKLLVNKVEVEKEMKIMKDSGELDERPSKKVKLGGFKRVADDKNKKSGEKLTHDSNGCDPKVVFRTTFASEDKSKPKLRKDLYVTGNGASRKPKLDEMLKVANGKLLEASFIQASNEGWKIDDQILEVTRRSEVDKSKWFKELPWEVRMQTAHERGTLVLLQNLDPLYSSTEVEDIILDALKENCSVKIIQRITFSSPHFGQAFVIFKTREAAEKAVTKLDESCLLLPNGRPLVGSIATPYFPTKRLTFHGHLVIDKFRPQIRREMREAVSTSHCSQPNTLEYDMAMEWCLLQERLDLTWKMLHEQQGQELGKLYSSMKSI